MLAYYQESAYAITAKRLDHHRLDQLPYSKTFRKRFPLFNATIWSYHYLQVAVYDPLQAARDLAAKTQAVRPILATYRRYLEQPPVEWTFMPLTAELSPSFAARYPEIANIFDNLHMLHDNISDILTSELLPTWEAKRAEIYRMVNTYYLASADATNPMIVKERSITIEECRHAQPSVSSPSCCWDCGRVTGSALDHDNLDPNRPIGMEDAYAIPKGEIGMEGGVRFNDGVKAAPA